MKAGDVLRVLQISRVTLYNYRKRGYIRAVKTPGGQYNYNGDDVYRIRNNQPEERLTVIYGRVSTYKQKHDLENQMQELRDFAKEKGYTIDKEYSDICSGITFNRKEFNKMIDLILEGRVRRVIITHKDRLSRTDLKFMNMIFEKFQTELVVISEVMNEETDEQEIFEEIIRLLHSFSMRYAKRKSERKRIEETLEGKE